jgi:hypothetical protein
MALLDYLFPLGETMQRTPGLLGEDEEKKMRQQAQVAGLLNFGTTLLANSGQTSQPMNFGQRIAPAILGGYNAAQSTTQDQQRMLDMRQKQLAEQAKALEPKLTTVKKGEVVYSIDPKTKEATRYLEGAPDLPSNYQNALAALGLPLDLVPKDLPPNIQRAVQDQMQRTSGGSNVNLSVSTEKTFGGAFAGKIADQDAIRYDIATKAPSVLDSVDRSRKLLESNQVFTGALANQKLELAKFGQAIGATGKNTDELVSNTQQLMATRAQATLDSIKASGLGSGQGFTDKDRQFLENARLGNITYSKKALEQQLEIEEKAARGSVDIWNQRVKDIPKSAKEPLGIGEVTLPKRETATNKRKVYNPATGKVE